MTKLHTCGGVILQAKVRGRECHYCDQCGAFSLDGTEIPEGEDREHNRAAWKCGTAMNSGKMDSEQKWVFHDVRSFR